MKNLFEGIPVSMPDELFETLVEAQSVRIERIVSRGQSSPEGFWYEQEQSEWVVVLRGRAKVRFEGGAGLDLGPGDHLDIPALRRHRVDWTTPDEPTVWLAVHYEPRLAKQSETGTAGEAPPTP